jgi:NAD(P)-dependent dehydrogenase (short-subunit alcohol dehydrogenase family)
VGRAVARLIHERGGCVVAGARDPSALPERSARFVPVGLDVTDRRQCAAAVESCVTAFGKIDVLANVAGVGLVGAVEETPEDLARQILEVNFWGAVTLTKAAVGLMRQRGSGHIVQVSSLSGRVCAPGNAFYAASKFALEGFSESLAAELAPHGVRVSIIEPGGIRTDWAGDSLQHAPRSGHYESTAGRTREILATVHGHQPLSADDVALRIAEVASLEDPPLRVIVGDDATSRIRSYLQNELSRFGGPHETR